MTVPVQFFQTAAAVIPTLLIALTLSAKQGDRLATSLGKLENRNKRRIFAALLSSQFVFFIGMAELLAFLAIVTGANELWMAGIVGLAVAQCLALVLYEWLHPVLLMLVGEENSTKATIAIMLFWGMSLVPIVMIFLRPPP